MKPRTIAVKIAAASALGALSLVGGGVAVAATGALPGTAQQTAKDALARVGVSVPGPADDAVETTTTRGGSDATETAAATDDASTVTSGHGDAVSELATTTDFEGADKGAAVSELASDGKSKAGAHPTATAAAAAGDDGADAATKGRAAADEHSGGAATAGAGNADIHKP